MNTLSLRLETAQDVLLGNRQQGFTIPTKRLYPFQWNWDSGFICLGYSHIDLNLAISELTTLFSGQWQNGMIPHILFHSEQEKSYFPNHDFWQPEVNPAAPLKPRSSGITQPPVHGFILEALWEQHPDSQDLKGFIRRYWSKFLASHRFFYQYRDPLQEGLAFMYHPWESGRDNSPLWDEPLNRIHLNPGDIPVYERQDTKLVDAAERPTHAHYDRYVYLLELGKRHRYDGPGIAAESPFLVQDSLINAVLIRSNTALIRLGKVLKLDTGELEEWQQQSQRSFQDKLWHEELGVYTCYDLHAKQPLAQWEIGGVAALFGGTAETEQATRIEDQLLGLREAGFLLCPSYDVYGEDFDPKRYWRGPIWPQMNWLIARGLAAYGLHQTAQLVRDDFLALVSQFGFFEYFDPRQHVQASLQHGYGGNHFSWTAACYLDLALRKLSE